MNYQKSILPVLHLFMNLFNLFMSTSQDLIKNPKPRLIRRISKSRTWSINIPLALIKKANLLESDYLFS